MLWKLYFWIILFLNTLGIVVVYSDLTPWKFSTWIEVMSSLLAIIGLFSYVFNKKVAPSKVWFVYFWIMIFSWIFSFIYVFTPINNTLVIPQWLASETVTSGSQLLFGMLVSAPTAYAIYKLGCEKKAKATAHKRVVKEKPKKKKVKSIKKPA